MNDRSPAGGRRATVLLKDVAWPFRGEPFADRAEFSRKVREWQLFVGDTDSSWRPEEVVVRAPRIRIQYFGVRDPEDEEYQDFTLDLASDDGESFTAEELLFKLHNAVAAGLRETDHQYFEGLEPLEPAETGGVPTYRMVQGS